MQTRKQPFSGEGNRRRGVNDVKRGESRFYPKTRNDSLILEYTSLLGQIEQDIKQCTSFKPGNKSELLKDRVKEIKTKADLEEQISQANRNSKEATNFKIQKVFDTVVFLHPEKQEKVSNMVTN